MSSFNPPALKCALVEWNDYHDEVFPSWVYYLNRLGYFVDLYTSEGTRNKNIFPLMKGLHFQVFPVEALNSKPDYPFLVLNSVEHKARLEEVYQLLQLYQGCPFLYVVHNPDLLRYDDDYRRLAEVPRQGRIVLGRHGASYLQDIAPARWLFPGYFGTLSGHIHGLPRWTEAENGLYRFCIQGNIHPFRKNYQALLEAVDVLRRQTDRPLCFSIVGSSDNDFGYEFRRVIDEMGMTELFTFTPPLIPYAEYYQSILNTQCLLPLVDEAHLHTYLAHKVTSSLSILLGLQRFGVVHETTAQIYGVQEGVITHPDGGLLAGMQQALTFTPEQCLQQQLRLRTVFDDFLAQSVNNLRDTLGSLDVPVPDMVVN